MQKLFLLIALLSFLVGCSTNPVSGQRNFNLISEAEEQQIGSQAHQEILQEYTPYNHPQIQQYVSRIGAELARQSHRSNLQYQFTVVDSPEINAFALPGGYIYITRGIMAYLNSEAELAGVLGHEIGHVTARHGTQQHSASMATNAVVDVATGILGATYGNQQLFSTLGKVGSQVLVNGYGRDHELEADRLGAQYLARVGYAPENMIRVVEVLKAQETFDQELARLEGRQPRSYHGLFSTHPSNDKRLQAVILAARNIPTAGSRPENRDGYLRTIQNMSFNIGDKPIAKVVLVRAKTGDTFAKLAAQSSLKQSVVQRLRLLNGLYPNGEPTPGQLLKIIK